MNEPPLFPAWTALFGFVLGAFVGSFLNMAIYRLPRGLSFVQPSRSFCPRCKHSLSAIDLAPLLSWLSTGGKCRYCKEPVAVRYFLVEMLTGGLMAAFWFVFMCSPGEPQTVKMVAYSIVASALVAVIFIDWELFVIPDELNAFILVVGVTYAAVTHQLPMAFWGAFTGWAVIWGIAFFGRLAFQKDAMGHGDIKLMRGVGAVLGPMMVGATVAIAVVVGLVVSILILALTSSKRKAEEASHEEAEAEPYQPESIGSLLKLGVWYLLCLDVFALFAPGMYRWIGEEPSETIEEEDWQPSLTTIPFGPYLAVGALACMLFGATIEKGIRDYWENATGGAGAGKASARTIKSGTLGYSEELRMCTVRGVNWGQSVGNIGTGWSVSYIGESGADCA